MNNDQNSKDLIQSAPNLATQSSNIIRRGLDSLLAPQARIICFPTTQQVGTLYIRGDEWVWNSWEPYWLTWQKFAQAIGSVQIPAKKSLRLDVAPDAANDLSFLRKLNKGDLQSLNLRSSQVNDDALINVAGLRGLKLLSLSETPVTDDGMVHLQLLHSLRILGISYTCLTD